MNLKIKIVRNGDISHERVVLSVVLPDDVGKYVVLQVDTSEKGDGPTNSVERAYWFPDKKVKAGDFVVLYTKEGEDKEKLNNTGYSRQRGSNLMADIRNPFSL